MSDTSDIAAMLTDQVGRMFREQVDRSALSEAEAGLWPDALWRNCADMGLTSLLVPEAAGGSDLPWRAALGLFRILGHYSVPLPVGETAIAARLLADAGLAIPDGPLTFAISQASDGDVLKAVPWARNSSHLVLMTRSGGLLRTDCIQLQADAVTHHVNIARDPRDAVKIADLPVVQSASRAAMGGNPAMLYGALLRAGQMAGALRAITAMAVDYANIRVQFGKPIRTFQAVQQSLAQLASEAAAADVAAMAAAAALDRGDAFFETAVAKIRTGQAAGIGSALGHQAHGAIGFTDEHSLHYLTRRLLSWRTEYGSERYWASKLGRRILDADAQLWHVMTDPALHLGDINAPA